MFSWSHLSKREKKNLIQTNISLHDEHLRRSSVTSSSFFSACRFQPWWLQLRQLVTQWRRCPLTPSSSWCPVWEQASLRVLQIQLTRSVIVRRYSSTFLSRAVCVLDVSSSNQLFFLTSVNTEHCYLPTVSGNPGLLRIIV